ncbi:MAG: cell division protein FtsB [Candidatus Azotimanducaceae bacterium]|jgi:cell division protein FtsB
MAGYNRKGNIQKLFFSKYMAVLILLLCGYLTISVYERYTVEREMVERKENVIAEYADLQNRKDVLQERVEYLNGESGIESEIRRNFDVAKDGEQVVIIVDEDPGATEEQSESSEPEVKTREPWYKFW